MSTHVRSSINTETSNSIIMVYHYKMCRCFKSTFLQFQVTGHQEIKQKRQLLKKITFVHFVIKSLVQDGRLTGIREYILERNPLSVLCAVNDLM